MLTATSHQVLDLHARLKLAFREQIEGPIDIIADVSSKNVWRGQTFSGVARFSLTNVGGLTVSGGRKRIVVRLSEQPNDGSDSAWVAWTELWEASKQGNLKRESRLDLVDAGLNFYWGRHSAMNLIFRAEWTNESSRPINCGHPHWHIDQSPLDTGLKASRLHLAMGGWSNQPDSPPSCWHVPLSTMDALANWAIRTLAYGADQIRVYPPSPERNPLAEIQV